MLASEDYVSLEWVSAAAGEEERWRRCVTSTSSLFGISLASTDDPTRSGCVCVARAMSWLTDWLVNKTTDISHNTATDNTVNDSVDLGLDIHTHSLL